MKRSTRLGIDPSRHHLHYRNPVARWDEGLPLGNGLLGLLVWGDGHPLNLSVDRSDLWDNRPDPKIRQPEYNWRQLRALVDRGDMKRIASIFEQTGYLYPTKLPCGRLQLDFGAGKTAPFESHLDFATAISTTRLGAATVTAYVHAVQPLIVLGGRGGRPRVTFLCAFDTARRNPAGLARDQAGANILKLGYPPLRKGQCDGAEYILQPGAGESSFAVAWMSVRCGREWLLYLTIQRATSGGDPLAQALEILAAAKAAGAASLLKSHRAWWRNYWRRGHIRLPEARMEHVWYAGMYKLGAAARADTPPIALQGVWTADEQNIPPWRGDYHHDLNTQMTYWPVHTSGRVAASLGFAKWLHGLQPKYQAFARDFYGAPGANVPGSHSLTGEIVPGWAAYMYSRTNIGWLLQHLWWHWRYTLDRDYLRAIAYPFMREAARFIVTQLTPDDQGLYHVRYSSSPEFYHNWRESFATDSTYDLSLVRYALEVTAAAARILRTDHVEAAQWDRVRAHLQPYHLAPENRKSPSPEGGLAIWKGQRLSESHRHPAQCMPIFPLGDINIEGNERDRRIIRDTLSEIESMGTGFWCGYSFAWLACLAARIREPRRMLWNLRQYLDHFTSPNTFHLNGDFRETGVSRFHYRPFTLEGNFGAAHAVNEMLLQSWGGRLRLFPAVPEEWCDVAFTDLRAEGAFVVSARRCKGQFIWAEIVSEQGQPVRLEHPHPGRPLTVRPLRQTFAPGRDIRFSTRAGVRYTLL